MTPALLPADAADGFVQLAAAAPLHADPDRVVPHELATSIVDGALVITLPPISWAAIRLA